MALSVQSFLTLCLVLVLALVVPAFAQVPPFFTASANPPFVSRDSLSATTFYGRTYLYGGYIESTGAYLNDVWRSSDDGANWSLVPLTGLPPRRDGALVTIQTTVNNTQLLLSIAGRGDGGVYYNDVYFSTNGVNFIRSSTAAFSPRAFFASAIALPQRDQSNNPLLNGLPALFIFGGAVDGGGVLNDVWYSSGRGQFGFVLATAAAPWVGRRGHSAVPVESGTRIVITGGTDSNGYNYYNDVWISDVGAVNWIRLIEVNSAPFSSRVGFGFVNIAEKLFLFGGGGPAGLLNDIWSSQDYGRSWTRGTVDAAFTPRGIFGVAVNGKDVVVIDGLTASTGVARVLNGILN